MIIVQYYWNWIYKNELKTKLRTNNLTKLIIKYMIKKLSFLALTITLFTSCVSKKIYTDLEDKYTNLKKENRSLTDEVAALSDQKTSLLNDFNQLQSAYDAAIAERDKFQTDYAAAKSNLETLKASYKALEENSSASIAENSQKNRELLAQLEAKEQALAAENERLEYLETRIRKSFSTCCRIRKCYCFKRCCNASIKRCDF